MTPYNYLRSLVVAPLILSVTSIAITVHLGTSTPFPIYWFMYWFGGALVVITTISVFVYAPIFALTWSWFKNAPIEDVERKIWLFPVPYVLIASGVSFDALLAKYAAIQSGLVILVLYGYMAVGMSLYYVAKRGDVLKCDIT